MKIEKIKEEILNSQEIDDVIQIDNKVVDYYRDKFYNNVLQDKEIEEKLCKIFGVDKMALQNVLMINGNPPLDDFDEEEKN